MNGHLLRRSVVALCVLTATALGAPRAARAQANYRLAPVGGRTTLVGGTGLAFGRDSASAFLNPATVVRVDPGRLAFSVNFYELSLFTSSRWYQPGPVDRARFGDVPASSASITKVGFDTLPSSLCIFLRIGEIPFLAKSLAKETTKDLRESQARLGLCLATVQENDFSLSQEDYNQSTATGGTRQAQSVRQRFVRFAAGPTYAMYITNALAVGASLHVSRAGFSSVFATNATTYGTNGRPISTAFFSAAHGDSYDLSATVGATYRIGRYQTVAIAFEAPSLHVFGPGGLNRYTHNDAAGEATSSLTANGDFAAYTPLRLALGTGVERSWGSAEVNVSYHLPTGPAYRATFDGRSFDVNGGVAADRESSLHLSADRRGAVNIGVGGEVFIAPYLSLLGGVGTDLSAARNAELTRDTLTYLPSHTNRLSGSLGLGSHGDGGDLLVGGEISYGWGERLAVNAYQLPPRFETVSAQTFGLLFVIAGTTSFKAIKRVVNDLTEVVVPPTPPKKTAP